MFHEYALEPEMVAAWSKDLYKCKYFESQFGFSQGRLVSFYPKKWPKNVWKACDVSDMEHTVFTELMRHFKENAIRRRGGAWKEGATWIDNAIREHSRHPFRAIMASSNDDGLPWIITEKDLFSSSCGAWDNPHGVAVERTASGMVEALHGMLYCCRWVKFIDPYFVKGRKAHQKSLAAFLKILGNDRPVGPPESIEMHTSAREDRDDGALTEYLREFYGKVVPAGLRVILYRWRERPGRLRLHNRYVLTDIGGVSFQHGLDTGRDGETDDIYRLDAKQYIQRCRQYSLHSYEFEQAYPPLEITGG